MVFDTLIHDGTIVTCNPAFDIHPRGWVAVAGGRIHALGPVPVSGNLPAAREFLDARGGIVMPGLVNTHTHLPMTLFRGLADDLPLARWLNDYIFPAERSTVQPESVRWGTFLACAEMALSGTTTCCDGYFLEDAVAAAVRDVGLRGVLAQGVIDHPAPGVNDPAQNISVARKFIRSWHERGDRIRPSVFCHSPYTCGTDTIVRAKKLCDEFGLVFQIHTAETRWEHEHIQSIHGASPVGYLDRIGVLDERTLLVHCVSVNDADITVMAERGVKVSHNPESNMKLASGVAPVTKMLAAGVTVGLGTDGCASNNDLDLFQTMDLAAKLHKVMDRDPTALPAESTIRMATIEGARCLNLDREIGSIEPGKQADLIIIDTRAPHLTPIYHPASAVVYAAKGSDVRTVMVAGRLLVKDRQILTVDMDQVLMQVGAASQAIASLRKSASGRAHGTR